MDQDLLVTIIVPVYNRAITIIETLESIMKQNHKNWECIIVDDNSTDATVTVVASLISNDIRFQLFIKPEGHKRNAATSRNIGLQNAKGEYIQFLDSDDILSVDKIEKQLEILTQHSTFTMATCKWGKFTLINNPIQLYDDSLDYRNFENSHDYFQLIGKQGGFFPLHSFLVHRDLIHFSGYWNENLSINDDGEFFFRIIKNSDKIIFSEEGYVLYRQNTDNNLSVLNSEAKAKDLVSSWKIIEALYEARYNESDADYILKKKKSIYNELKINYRGIIKANRHFFYIQRKEDTFILRLKKIRKRIQNKIKLFYKKTNEGRF